MANHIITTIPGKRATLDELKQFSAVPFFIPWYHSSESNKVFPLFLNEVGELNASDRFLSKKFGKNPFFSHADITYLLAHAGAKPVGRLAVFIDGRYNQEHSENTGWIGMFECIEDEALAEELLQRAIQLLREQGCARVIGPAKYNANGEVGLLVDGFQYKPYFMESYHAPYYKAFFENLGFIKENDWISIQLLDVRSQKLASFIEKVQRVTDRLMQSSDNLGRVLRETKVRNALFSRFEDEIEIIKSLYNSEWAKGHHPQFVSMTDAEFASLASGIKLIALEDIILIAERGTEPIGVVVAVPNINEVIDAYDRERPSYLPSSKFLNPADIYRDISILRRIKQRLKDKRFETARVLILGVKGAYRDSGVDALLYRDSFQRGIRIGLKAGSFSQLADINADIIHPLKKLGEVAMTWRVYSQDI